MNQIGSRIFHTKLRYCPGPFDFPCSSTRHHDFPEEEPTPDGSTKSMTLFMACIPLMVLVVVLAVLPLILMSHAEHRDGRDGGDIPQQEPFFRRH